MNKAKLLTSKEKRYLEYIKKCEAEGFRPTIGDVCRECQTTPFTLLGKTIPGLRAKGLIPYEMQKMSVRENVQNKKDSPEGLS